MDDFLNVHYFSISTVNWYKFDYHSRDWIHQWKWQDL